MHDIHCTYINSIQRSFVDEVSFSTHLTIKKICSGSSYDSFLDLGRELILTRVQYI